MKFNLEEYIQLLKTSEYLKKQKKNLETENRADYLKVLKYGIKLSDYIHWKTRSQYLSLLKLFVNSKIDGSEFVRQYFEIFHSNEKIVKNLEKDFERLASIQLDPKSFGFSEWISEIELCCDEFYPDFEPQDKINFRFAKDEKELQVVLTDLIKQIEKY